MADRAGARSVVLDLFADRDTVGLCNAARRVCSDRALRFHGRKLLDAAAALAPRDASAGLVTGSGLEGRTRLLARLAEGRRLYGNTPETIARLKEPASLLPLLDSLGIPRPAVRFEPPAEPRGWLVKQAGGAGGVHVRPARSGLKARAGRYFQRFVAGRSMSVVFVADGHEARIIGFNEQWPAGSGCPSFPFSYGGAVSDAHLPEPAKARVETWVQRLTEHAGLAGLNGIDFMLDDAEKPHFLEINPRPTATAEFYDERATGGLFAWHVQACEGRLPAGALESGDVRAHTILYATAPMTVTRWVRWPGWVSDRPELGAAIAAGAPICTVHAAGNDARQVELLLGERSRMMMGSIVPLAA